MSEIKVTLESLYDILRNEKKKEDLQQLENSFYVDVVAYLRTKKALLDSQKDRDELFANNEREKLEYELRSIKRILKEIYEKREKKIIDIALNKSRTRSDIIETDAMLREEKQFYDRIVILFDTFRTGVLLKLFKGELPFLITDHATGKESFSIDDTPNLQIQSHNSSDSTSFSGEKKKDTFKKFENVDGVAIGSEEENEDDEDDNEEDTNEEGKSKSLSNLETPSSEFKFNKKDEKENSYDSYNSDIESDNYNDSDSEDLEDTEFDEESEKEDSSEESETEKQNNLKPEIESSEPKQEMIKVKFLHPVPRFIWKDMKEYGPFERDEEAEVFPEIAGLLVRKGRAENI